MSYENAPSTEDLIFEIQELAELAEELNASMGKIGADLTQLYGQLWIRQQLHFEAYQAPTTRPN